jgi:non-ribosomal peptide synthetase component F
MACLAGVLTAGVYRGSAAPVTARAGSRNKPRHARQAAPPPLLQRFDVDLTYGGDSVTGYAGRALERPVSLCGLLRAGLDANPDGLALICADTRWTWRTLDDLSDRLAVSLLGLGLNPGDRVASLMPNRPALIVHYLACFKAGLVATPLNYRYMAPEIDHALRSAEPCPARACRAGGRSRRKPARPAVALGTISYGGKPGAGPAFEG